jgi:hypothetical protein
MAWAENEVTGLGWCRRNGLKRFVPKPAVPVSGVLVRGESGAMTECKRLTLWPCLKCVCVVTTVSKGK